MGVDGCSGPILDRVTSNPWTKGTTGQRGAARAEITADGYDQYWRDVIAGNGPLVDNFRLRRMTHIKPGESVVLPVSVDDGDCVGGWLGGHCRIVHVDVAISGNVTVQAASMDADAEVSGIEVCCVDGDERYGNPVTIPGAAGTEYRVVVGLKDSFTGNRSVIVKTSFDP